MTTPSPGPLLRVCATLVLLITVFALLVSDEGLPDGLGPVSRGELDVGVHGVPHGVSHEARDDDGVDIVAQQRRLVR
jgi:hypothetical protein